MSSEHTSVAGNAEELKITICRIQTELGNVTLRVEGKELSATDILSMGDGELSLLRYPVIVTPIFSDQPSPRGLGNRAPHGWLGEMCRLYNRY